MTRTLGLLINAEHNVPDLIEVGQLGESLGYGTLWYTDLRLARDCYVGLSVLAAHTSKVRLGPCVSDPYTAILPLPLQPSRASMSFVKAAPCWDWALAGKVLASSDSKAISRLQRCARP